MKFLARSISPLLNVVSQSLRCASGVLVMGIAALSMTIAAHAQQNTPAPANQTIPAATAPVSVAMPATSSAPAQAAQTASGPGKSDSGEVTEDELKQQLVGKPLFLRGGYLGDSLTFNEHGTPVGHPTVGSYTLCAVEIEKVHLSKHKVELVGTRYALHFLGALPSEDPSAAVDRVKITPKKKMLRITIDREQVIKEKKTKEVVKGKKPAPAAPASASAAETAAAAPTPAPDSPDAAPAAETPAAQAADRPADQASVTTTLSPAHAARVLREALDRIFAPGLDEKLRAQMPAFWQLYYQAQAAQADYRPRDPSVLRSTAVDTQAKVTSSIAPDSNEYAQASGIAGRALYRVVIGADGKPGEIAVVRPIGFGLDENAVAAIRKASFQSATKAGQPVAETLDLAVLFRIYSKRTSVTAETATEKAADAAKPGPYTVRAQQSQEKPPDSPPQAKPDPQQ